MARFDDTVADMSEPLTGLFHGAAPAPDRIFHHNVWFRGAHNNVRYDALLPRLSRIDNFLAICSGPRIVRGAEFRALRATAHFRHRVLFGAASSRYRFAFCTGPAQVPWFRGKVVVDVDDPAMTSEEAALLGRANVEAYVVTVESAARQLEVLDSRSHTTLFPNRCAWTFSTKRVYRGSLPLRGRVAKSSSAMSPPGCFRTAIVALTIRCSMSIICWHSGTTFVDSFRTQGSADRTAWRAPS